MGPQRYERVSPEEHHDSNASTPTPSRPSSPGHQDSHTVPSSPPPSFRSRASSRRQSSTAERDPLVADADRTLLTDTFDHPSDSETDDDEGDNNAHHGLDERQRVMSGRPEPEPAPTDDGRPRIERRVTQLPLLSPPVHGQRPGVVHDGVFANLSAKPERGEDSEEKPPAAADATPPYWENTIFAPAGSNSDEVYIDGLPIGSFFSFIWNGMISMSFQLVGFLLTYLLHSSHAAKNGSKAGLGITLIQYGFGLKGASHSRGGDGEDGDISTPQDPNNHNFDPNAPITADSGSNDAAKFSSGDDVADPSTGFGAMAASDWLAYVLMIVGWFILIRALSEYLKARRHEALVLQSPSRGLPVAVVAEGEEVERTV